MDAERRRRILVVSEGSVETGYGRVAAMLLDRLADTYDCALFAIDRRAPVVAPAWRFHANDLTGDTFGLARFPAVFAQAQPDVVMFIYDFYLFGTYRRLIPQLAQARTIVYCPIDGTIADDRAFAPLEAADRLVVFTEFARAELLGAFDRLRARGATRGMPVLAVIPHPIDTDRFSRLPGPAPRAEARRRLFGDTHAEGDFIVLNANRNTTRKRIDLTLDAFARFARDKAPHVKLLLHMEPRDRGVDIAATADRLGIADRLILSCRSMQALNASDERLNLIYNACDVGVNTSVGEGWGLVSFEHAATGAAQLVPAHSVLPELWDGSAMLVDAPEPFEHPREAMRHRIVDVQELARALDRLYRAPDDLRDWSARASRNAHQDAFRPEAVARRWRTLIDGLLVP